MLILVIMLILAGVIVANFLVAGEYNKEKVDSSEDIKEVFALVRDMPPETELELLLEYKFKNKNFDSSVLKKIDNRFIGFTTNHSYTILEKIWDYKEYNRVENLEKIKFLEKLVIENGFPSVLGLSKFYIRNIYSEEKRNYVLELLIKFSRINIEKFIEITESEINDGDFEYFKNDKKTLERFLNNENI